MNTWQIIYRAIRAIVLVGILAGMAVLLQAVLGGPLLVWLVLMAGLVGGVAFAWRKSGGALLLQARDLQARDRIAQSDPIPDGAASVDLQPTPPDVFGKLGALGQGFFKRLEAAPNATSSAIHKTHSLWHLPLTQALFFGVLSLAGLVVAGLRLFKLDTLQSEVYGDINIVHEYLFAIRDGEWPTYFSLSSGPLYHYLIYPLIQITGQSYFGIKFASALVSLLALLFLFLLCRRLVGDWFAVIAVFIGGVSSWLLVFSRLGNSQILLPLLTTLSLYLLVRFKQDQRRIDLMLCAFFSTLGLYGYPQSFVMPAAIFMALMFMRTSLRQLTLFVIVAVITALPFIPIFNDDPNNFVRGYIGGKLAGNPNPIPSLITNLIAGALAFHVKGDSVFRSNPPGLPHLDLLSGVLMLAGMAFWFGKERHSYWPVLLIPFAVLQVPSIMVLNFPGEVPSASRTLAVAPVVYIFVASGLWWLLRQLRQRSGLPAATGAGLIGLAAIFGLNADRYFNQYISGLPYQNTPVARTIQKYTDTLSPDTHVYLAGCCWQEGMPEPKSIQFEMKYPKNLEYVDPLLLTCDALNSYPVGSVFVWAPSVPVPSLRTQVCANALPAQTYFAPNGQPAFNAATLQIGQPLVSPLAVPANPENPTGVASPLKTTTAQLDGSEIEFSYSALDIGQLENALDNNPETLMRGAADNPFIIEMNFAQPRKLSGIALTTATMHDVGFYVTFTQEDGNITSAELVSKDLPTDPRVVLKIEGGPQTITHIRIEIMDQRAPPGEGFHTHVREIALLP